MTNFLISICIPAFKAEKYILETLNSIKAQTYKNWEIIVIEDASNDGTKKIVEEFSKECHNRISYFKNEENIGVASTRNKAAEISKGDWIAFIDSDDLWREAHLEDLISILNIESKAELVHSLFEIFDTDTREIINKHPIITGATLDKFPLSLYDRSYFIQTSSVMISRRLFEQTGGFKSYFTPCEDLELWFRSAKMGFKFACTNNYTSLYRKVDGGGLTSNSIKLNYGTAKVYQEYLNWDIIPQKIRTQFITNNWISLARIARNENDTLAKSAILMSIKSKITFYNLMFYLYLIMFTRNK